MPALTVGEQLYTSRNDLIEGVIRGVARRSRLSSEDAEDFAQVARLKLVKDNYSVLRRFSGESSMTTYLMVVVQNELRSYRIAKWGRWRPSAAAQRLGTDAMRLEELISRDGFSDGEAVETLVARFGKRSSRKRLEALAALLPPRCEPTRVRVTGLGEDSLPSQSLTAESSLARTEVADRVGCALRQAIDELACLDRLLLRMHYFDGMTVTRVARILDLNRRQLYSRFDRIRRRLYASIKRSGVTCEEVAAALGWKEVELGTFLEAEASQARRIETEPQAKA